MRLVFVGAVEGSYVALQTLLESGGEVSQVYTLAPQYSQRHSDFVDLAPLGKKFGVEVVGIRSINDSEVILDLRSLAPDYLLVIGWSQLLKRELLRLPKLGAIGFHPTLLPENRGRAAIPWTILRGLRRSGTTIFFLDEGMDSGDIISQCAFEVVQDETARSLYNKVTAALRDIIQEITPGLMRGELPRYPQDHSRATYTAKRTARDGLIDWQLPAEQIWTLIRALSEPYPGAFTFFREKRVIVWQADFVPGTNYWGIPGQLLRFEGSGVLVQCGNGYLRLRIVQEEGKEPLSATQYFHRMHEILGIDWLKFYENFQKLRGGNGS